MFGAGERAAALWMREASSMTLRAGREAGQQRSGPDRVCLSCRSALVVTRTSVVKAMIKKESITVF